MIHLVVIVMVMVIALVLVLIVTRGKLRVDLTTDLEILRLWQNQSMPGGTLRY